ncbi:hypothetical protein E8E12_001324 [Didymella heteroderae]|uniref:Sugar phosphate phosphatase n=1 Tax=Didymella heteroderae TaxID=1769908 RepID=A0A9P5BW06_9PLEO|nr:hypothetical protein E8E12_001324 [Didymella heteroderae]
MPGPVSLAEQVKEVWTSDDGSMAKDTASNRWPKIVQGMVDDVAETAATSVDRAQREEALSVQASLKEIKDELLQNRVLRPLPSDGRNDIPGYNERLEQLGGKCTWQGCPWLFGECYLYRRVHTIFALTNHWRDYDIFKRQKDSTFAKSCVAVEELSARYMQVIANSKLPEDTTNEEARKLLFVEMTEVALWGNATDLSLLSNLSLDQIQGLQGREAIAKSQRNIVDNDTDAVWQYLSNPLRSNRRIDIVLDNAGFEFFTDVIYAAYLLESGLASVIVFHVKDFPWFVSDVIPSDVESLFQHLESASIFSNRTYIDKLVPRLRAHFDSGAMSIKQHSFWTTAYSFHQMDALALGLFKSLQSSSLVIFKGDLNYRKLTKDGLWPHTTPFIDAIGSMGAGSGIKVLALRTNKSDTCVGLESQERVDALNEEAPHGAWIRNGKYAVVSFSDGE